MDFFGNQVATEQRRWTRRDLLVAGSALALANMGCRHAQNVDARADRSPLDHLDHLDKGVGDGAVVFLPGLGADLRQFADDVEALSQTRRCIALTMRGHAGSVAGVPAGQAYGLPLLARDVLDTLDALNVSAAHIVGNSMGGLVAFEVLRQRPSLVRSLTTFGTTAELHRGGLTAWTVVSLTRLLGASGMGWLASSTASDDERVATLVGTMMAGAQTDALAGLADAIADYSYLELLRSTSTPYLLLKGERDSDINAELATTLAVLEARPAAYVIGVDDAGHFLNLERPTCFRQLLTWFWSGPTGSAPACGAQAHPL